MSKSYKPKKYRHYRREEVIKSAFDDSATLVIHRYLPPASYKNAINDVIAAFKSDIPFSRAVDQVAALYPKTINRNKLAEHTLKAIANDYDFIRNK